MKMKWMLLLCFTLVTFQAKAEEPVVIDVSPADEMSPPANAEPASQEAQTKNDKATIERVLKEGKASSRQISPKQRAALANVNMTETNKHAGEDYMEKNKSKPGVVTLASGIQYRILKTGSGKKPEESNSVSYRYQAKLIDGSIVDKLEDKTPAPMHVAGLMPGLKEAIKMMSKGAKWEVVIPPELAYGTKGNRSVGPNAVLIYVIEIVSVI